MNYGPPTEQELAAWTSAPDDERSPTCADCGATCMTDDGCEPTPICHHCAQAAVPRLVAALRDARGAGKAP